MQLVPFWWMTLSPKEKFIGIPLAVILFSVVGVVVALAERPRPAICQNAVAAFFESNDDIEKATALPQEERCSAYQRRVSFLQKLNGEWAGCLPFARRGDVQGSNIAAESNFYARLVEKKCSVDLR